MPKKPSADFKKPSAFKGRPLAVRVQKNKFSSSSQNWLNRQLNDPYVLQSKVDGYRSRAAYKLLQIDQKFQLFRANTHVVDLGASPGGWTQVAIEKVRSSAVKPKVFALDLLEFDPLPGAVFLQGDFLDELFLEKFRTLYYQTTGKTKADVILSDMAAASTGHSQTDHLRIMHLLQNALDFTYQFLNPGGHFVGKVLRGGTEHTLLQILKKRFQTVRHYKPAASRSDSAEMYVVALSFLA